MFRMILRFMKCLISILSASLLVLAFNNCGKPMKARWSEGLLSSTGNGRLPLIVQQPTSVTSQVGTSVSFTVTVDDAADMTYQWNKNSVPVSGANQDTFTISNLVLSDAGNFSVTLSNPAGQVKSQVVTLTVNSATPTVVAPSISSQPAGRTVVVGAAVSFSVAANGSAPLIYQWMKNGINISGATSNTHSIASAQSSDGGKYSVRVSNSGGTVTSDAVTLTVNSPPVISSEFPGPTNTGYRNAPGFPGSLTPFSGTITSNTTYRFMKFTDGLYIRPGVSNVTFYGCQFTSNAVDNANVVIGDYGDATVNNIIFDYSSFEPKAVNAPPTTYNKGYQYGVLQRSSAAVTIDHSDFWG